MKYPEPAAASIAIVDYGMGNVRSVQCALSRLGCESQVSADPKVIEEADGIILPGVGAFKQAIENLNARNLVALLNREVQEKGKPILGICLGMQLFAESSTEGGFHKGFGWLPGTVKLIDTTGSQLSVPHVGWNEVEPKELGLEKFQRIESGSHFFFDHSFHLETDDAFTSAVTQYGCSLTASVCNENIWGVQFHPEKSQTTGLKLLRNYLNFVSKSMSEARLAC